MDELRIALEIKEVIKKTNDKEVFKDYITAIRDLEKVDFDKAHELIRDYREKSIKALKQEEDAKFYFGEYKKSLLFDAPYDFDSYMLYIEIDKPRNKQFYAPRRHYLRPIVKGYQEVLDGHLRLLTVSMPKRSGKAVTLDTLIPTPNGMVTMGDIKVGDLVIGDDGKTTKVTDIFPQGKVPIYEVRFTDGAVIKTCANHLWTVRKQNINKHGGEYVTKVMSTKEILDCGLKGGNHNIFSIPYCKPVEFSHREVPIDPYVLGVLLGDGYLMDKTPTFTSFDEEVINELGKRLPDGDKLNRQDIKKGRYLITRNERNEKGYPKKTKTAEALIKLDLKQRSWEKHIPHEYLINDYLTRYDLLCGLLDTDGSCDTHGIEYTTTSPDLRDGIMFLVRSLGGKCSYSERMGKYKKDGVVHYTRPNYRITIEFPKGFSPFKLSRKKDRYTPQRETLYHYIDSIRPCGEAEAKCICVERHLFLASDYFVTTHNSQTGINFVNMISGKNPDKSTLMEGTGEALVTSFYNGCLEYLTEEEYNFHKIFPKAKLVQTNADTHIINLAHKSRFPTVMCRSIDARQVGLSEATNLLYLDDCVEGHDEAMNRELLDKKWDVIIGDIVGRAIEGTPIVMCGTRYSLYDPIGRMQENAEKLGWKYKSIEIPALSFDKDESNYEYEIDGKKFFTTQYFREQRELVPPETFEAEFQQRPFESKGILFNREELNYFYTEPENPDAIVAVCDTAESGKDSTALIVAKVYGEDVYIVDVVFDNATPEFTKPECAKLLMVHKVARATFESNNGGQYYARDVEEIIRNEGGRCAIKTKRTITNKQTRIEVASDSIIKHFYFLDRSKYDKNSQYDKFMRELTSYTRTGKVKHDDAPDAVAMLENEIRNSLMPNATIMQRKFF